MVKWLVIGQANVINNGKLRPYRRNGGAFALHNTSSMIFKLHANALTIAEYPIAAGCLKLTQLIS